MHPARIAELLQPFLDHCHSEPVQRPSEEHAVLSLAQLSHISTYIDILRRWNTRINLTAIRDEEEIVTRHFGESLFAARHLFPRTPSVSSSVPPVSSVVKDFDSDFDFANDQRPKTSDRLSARIADVGSGAGFPGIPIKLWAPEIALTLIESNHKKATFLREVIRALTLTNVNVLSSRAEQLADAKPAAPFEIVTLRAVERFADILSVADALLAPAARLALLIGSSQVSQARSLVPAIDWSQPIPIPQSQSRILMIGMKAETKISSEKCST